MKKIEIGIFLLAAVSTHAQTSIYHPFPQSNAIWNYGYHIISAGWISDESGYYSCSLTGDTIISAITYHKIYCTAVICDAGNCQRYVGYQGAFREDTLNKKVFYRLSNDISENVLYDFNINTGDTGHTAHLNYRVSAMDSVFVDSDYRKRWTIDMIGLPGAINQGHIIEGIGSESSMFDLYNHVSGAGSANLDFINCFLQNGVILYHPDTTALCGDLATGTEELKNKNAISIFPNPFSSELNISSSSAGEIVLVDLSGNEIRKSKIGEGVTTLNLENVANGFYLLQYNDKKTSITFKAIKQ